MTACRTCSRVLIGEEIIGGLCTPCRYQANDARELLESSRIQWRRDYDAIALGYVLGVLSTLVIVGVW